jgi:hypothetical protein
MGWYADTTWDITFHSQEAMDTFYAEHGLDVTTPEALLAECGENSDINMALDEPLHIVGWTGGKWLSDADNMLHDLAKYADGTVEFDTQDDELYTWRLAEGKVAAFNGVIVYPADPVWREEMAVWLSESVSWDNVDELVTLLAKRLLGIKEED